MPSEALRKLDPSAGDRWPTLARCHARSNQELRKLHEAIYGSPAFVADDTPLVVYGSLARAEYQDGSDLDWTLLVDGPVSDQHALDADAVRTRIETAGFKSPGRTGTFGHLTFSHDLAHRIGGTSDDNINTTRRVLLLLESLDVSQDIVVPRVQRAILTRYVAQDVPLSGRRSSVPRFLLNDFVRFWRTMAVDYACKTWERGTDGWAIRNVKLRFSRKLLFVKGLLACFEYTLSHVATGDVPVEYPEELEVLLRETPLDRLANFCVKFKLEAKAGEIVDEYERFLALLAKNGNRTRLETLRYENASEDELFAELRESSRKFQAALIDLFFRSDDEITKKTMEYGVF